MGLCLLVEEDIGMGLGECGLAHPRGKVSTDHALQILSPEDSTTAGPQAPTRTGTQATIRVKT